MLKGSKRDSSVESFSGGPMPPERGIGLGRMEVESIYVTTAASGTVDFKEIIMYFVIRIQYLL